MTVSVAIFNYLHNLKKALKQSGGIMYSVYDGFKKIKTDRKSFFAGANTGNGFDGRYAEIADENKLERVYIIKGGPGCGKSTFMKKTAESAEENGFSAEYFLCGSDPDSLDCVVLDGRIALLDGTPPHPKEMMYPGASSEIIDLTGFWNTKVLEQNRKEIVELTERKRNAYSSAYRYIKAAEAVEKDRRTLSEKIYNEDKARKYILNFIRGNKITKDNDYSPKEYYSHALTMRGAFFTDNCKDERIIPVEDRAGLGPLFMETLRLELEEKRISHTVSILPICRTVNSVSLDRYGICFVVSYRDSSERKINTSRFILEGKEKSLKGEMRLAGKCEKECLETALVKLAEAAEAHFALEEIYKSAMDFDRLEKYRNEVITGIVNRLKKQSK